MDNKRDLILRAAEKIIATEGLHNLSMQKLALDAGVAAGTIYRYFKDKDDLIIELRKNVLQLIANELLVDIEQGSFEERFKRLWYNIIKLGREHSHANLSFAQYSHLPVWMRLSIKHLKMKPLSNFINYLKVQKAKGLFNH